MNRTTDMTRTETAVPPSPADWHPEDIKALIRKRFGSLAALGSAWGMSRQSISGAILNPNCSAKLERRIAEALNMKPQTLWPSRWQEDGKPSRRTVRKNLIKQNSGT